MVFIILDEIYLFFLPIFRRKKWSQKASPLLPVLRFVFVFFVNWQLLSPFSFFIQWLSSIRMRRRRWWWWWLRAVPGFPSYRAALLLLATGAPRPPQHHIS
jgi:hypothetical protein